MSESKAYFIRNHSSGELREIKLADLGRMPSRKDGFADKQEYLTWCHDPATDHCFYNLFEPRYAGQRVTRDNPAAWLHGIVVDYDMMGKATASDFHRISESTADYPVTWTTQTFSGKIRALWEFQERIAVYNLPFAKAILGRLLKEMKLDKLAIGMDVTAYYEPWKYFELGTHWKNVNPGACIKSSMLATFAFQESANVDWKKEGRQIPLDRIEAEVERKWPGRWRGPFVVGAKGVRFWDAAATNPNGAWVRETGMMSWTGDGRFHTWEDLLGHNFVKKYDEGRISGAVVNVYHIAGGYWRKNCEGTFDSYSTDPIRRLFASQGLSKVSRKGIPSEVDSALVHIDFNQKRHGAFPFLFRDSDTIMINNDRYLNISKTRVLNPAAGPHLWGDRFPWISKYLAGLYREGQLDVFLSWHSYFYGSALRKDLKQGHAFFSAGGVGIGKTLLSNKIVGASVGGFAEATQFLLGEDKFNGNMFDMGLWTMDDAKATTDRITHAKYSELVKKTVANPSMTYRRMYSDGLTMPWMGRLMVSMNDDTASIGMLPSTEHSLMEKVIYVKATNPGVSFVDCETTITRELPYYLAFLRDYEIPTRLLGETRFGFEAYHHPELLATAIAASSTAEFSEILDIWRKDYFRFHKDDGQWEGSPTELLMAFNEAEGMRDIVRQTVKSASLVGRGLSKMVQQGSPIVSRGASHAGKRLYLILKP